MTMNSISDLTDFTVVDGDQVKIDSRAVAQHFSRRHADVLRSIRHLKCSRQFFQRNFAKHFAICEAANGRPLKYYLMTPEGFAFLVMGFTGKAAAARKEPFVDACRRLLGA
ncbi:hypothetical protein C7H84_09480 [Burkholderia sp. Nafp2/4-1b]|uniref:Rha family transcriptional regulator n=1 Tax=Burkholderia sp. Nafp2/4-1b TaxID=2116686 RepID=UPI000EF889EB|nr:Rha family transcriptional regulator [Burkholderia sp. Nafp2/4-1b]RKU03361.1 hypothetical protein C7H84_09480 [Burkholderia sp. Nafp2/4-1b]